MNLEIGTLVRLKSGGPVMTVARGNNGAAEQVECQWFAGSSDEEWDGGWGGLQSGVFNVKALTVVPVKAPCPCAIAPD